MKAKDIPQDESSLSKKQMRELYYVEDEEGNYATGLSSGWNPKKIALDLTLERIEEQLHEIKLEIKNGVKSPILYFMIQKRMDLSVLAAYYGKPKWLVKKHLNMKNFKKLSILQLEKYAALFEIDLEKLTHFNE